MAKDAKIICPMMGGNPCVEDGSIINGELVACRFWVTVQGMNPQTGEIANNNDCSFAWLPILMIENSKVNRETGAAVESFRNEMVKSNEVNTQVLIATANKNLIEG
jgi:hypothetical protein